MSSKDHQPRIISALDIGSSTVCAVIARVDENDEMILLGKGEASCVGIRRGAVVNVKETVAAIEAAVQEAELQADTKIDCVYVGISGEQIRSLNNTGVITISRGEARIPASQEITEEDVDRVMAQAQSITLPTDREILHVLPQEFRVDQNDGIKDPIAHVGHRLEAQVHVVTIQSAMAQNLNRCVEAAGLYCEALILAPLASSYAVLDKTERNQGVVMIDMGAGTTDLIVYYLDGVRHTSVIPYGGNRITNDVAQILHTTFENGEALKLEHGFAKFPATEDDPEITVEGIAGRLAQSVTRRGLSAIIEPRLEEIFLLCRNEVRKSEVSDRLNFGVVLTGGGMLLKEIKEKAGEVFNTDIKIGYPKPIKGLDDDLSGPQYATVIGLLLYGKDHQERFGVSQPPRSIGGLMSGLFGRLKGFFRELFQ